MTAELKASRSDTTLTLTIANPGQQNSVDSNILGAIIESLSKAERDDGIRCVILTGADRNFCGGIQSSKDLATQIALLESLQNLIETITSFPKPVIAAVEGLALDAGFSLALACDLIIAGQNAGFGISATQLGTWSVGGAPWFLSRSLPPQWLTEILLDTKPLPASRLHNAGLINRLSVDGNVLDKALEWAGQLSTVSQGTFEKLKTMLGDNTGATMQNYFSLERHRLLTKRSGPA